MTDEVLFVSYIQSPGSAMGGKVGGPSQESKSVSFSAVLLVYLSTSHPLCPVASSLLPLPGNAIFLAAFAEGDAVEAEEFAGC